MAASSDKVSHLCVLGVGGVGGYFGGRIAWALARQNDSSWAVHFVARGAHLAKMRSRGLILRTPEGRMTCKPASAVESLGQAPAPDVVFVCVKSYDLDGVALQIACHCHDDTVIVPLLNGVDIHPRLRARISGGHVLPACVFVGTHLERPGVVTQAGGEGVILMGRDPDLPEFVPRELLDLLDRVGISCRWLGDARPALWEKYIFISAFGLVTAASGRTLGEVLLDPVLMAEVAGIMSEVVELARSEGIDMGPDAAARAVAKANDHRRSGEDLSRESADCCGSAPPIHQGRRGKP